MITKVAPPGRPSSRRLKDNSRFDALVDSIDTDVVIDSSGGADSKDVNSRNYTIPNISSNSSSNDTLADNANSLVVTESNLNFHLENFASHSTPIEEIMNSPDQCHATTEQLPDVSEVNLYKPTEPISDNIARNSNGYSVSPPVSASDQNTEKIKNNFNQNSLDKSLNNLVSLDTNLSLESQSMDNSSNSIQNTAAVEVQNEDRIILSTDNQLIHLKSVDYHNTSQSDTILDKETNILKIETPALIEERARINSRRQRREEFLSKITSETTNAEANLLSNESQHKEALDRGTSLVTQQIQISSTEYVHTLPKSSSSPFNSNSVLQHSTEASNQHVSTKESSGTLTSSDIINDNNDDTPKYEAIPAASLDTSYLNVSAPKDTNEYITSSSSSILISHANNNYSSNNNNRYSDSESLRVPSRIAAIEDTSKQNKKKGKETSNTSSSTLPLPRVDDVAQTIASGLRETYQGSEQGREAWMARQQDLQNQRKGKYRQK